MTRETKPKELTGHTLKIEYEPEVDILTVHFQPAETNLDSSTEQDGTILNYGHDGRLASVEILDASKRYPAGQLAAYSVDELIDLKRASALSSIAAVTLRTQAERGRLWAMKLGGQWVTSRERLQQYLNTRARTAKSRLPKRGLHHP